MRQSREKQLVRVRIDEEGNTLVQLFNILLESIANEVTGLRESVEETYSKLLASLAVYVDFDCLHPVQRYLLEQSLMSDVILSHLEAIDSDGKVDTRNWLKLSGRTKGLIAIALAKCARRGLELRSMREALGLRVEKV